jgi:hypothetical protein
MNSFIIAIGATFFVRSKRSIGFVGDAPVPAHRHFWIDWVVLPISMKSPYFAVLML